MFDDIQLFYSECRQNFTSTGAVMPSSPLLGKAMARPLAERPDRSIQVLEVGPGTGAFTHHILRHLRSNDRFDMYELNRRFYLFLKANLPWGDCAAKGIECCLYNADIRNVSKELQYDYIICGLPFNNFEPQTVFEILHILIQRLTPTGVLSYFEYVFSHKFKAKFLKPSERSRMIQVGAIVKNFIQKHQYDYHPVWLNVPPARARYCRTAGND
jgi:phosphatidylethanolamine/phosphatidyl-N-methylethanolamine N-methyltransferase